MRTTLQLAIVLICLYGECRAQQVAQAAASTTPSQGPVVMTVGDRKITVSEVCSAIGSLPPPQRKGYALHPALAKDWFGPLVALAEEAKREHLSGAQDPKLNEVDRDNALVGDLIAHIAQQTEPTESEIESYYQGHKSEFEQARARHILISDATALASRSKRSADEAQAKAAEIASEIKNGADFASLAAKDSEDPYTREKGGELGYVSHLQMEPAVDNTLWSLTPGETSAPFEGRFGYEIVRVEDRRTQPLEAVRDVIVGKIKSAAFEQRQQEIVAAAHVTLQPDYLNAPLPCDSGSRAFTLPNSLQAP
jgi:PPIC-type PPIASE domain